MNDHKGFFAMMARMKYIERWALMRNSVSENICEHSLEVLCIAHGLGITAGNGLERIFRRNVLQC